jgi:hypothetical protein
MQAFRIVKERHALTAFSGDGARTGRCSTGAVLRTTD